MLKCTYQSGSDRMLLGVISTERPARLAIKRCYFRIEPASRNRRGRPRPRQGYQAGPFFHEFGAIKRAHFEKLSSEAIFADERGHFRAPVAIKRGHFSGHIHMSPAIFRIDQRPGRRPRSPRRRAVGLTKIRHSLRLTRSLR